MKLEPIGLLGDCFKPDQSHPYNFMLDTSAINKLAERPKDLNLLALAKEHLQYIYFRNLIQDREINGIKSDGSCCEITSEMAEKSKAMRRIIDDLPIIRIPHMATLMRNAWILDGTCHILEDEGTYKEVFTKVFNSNPKHREDAVIIESAMRFNCILVTHDARMCKKTNSVFPARAIKYEEFVDNIRTQLQEFGVMLG